MPDLPENPAEALHVLDDEAIALHTDAGRTDHVAAARRVQAELDRLAGGGLTWAAHMRDRAEVEGHTKRIKARIKSLKRVLPTRSGSSVIVPAAYSRKNDDGVVQLTLWYELPLDDLVALIEDITSQAKVLTERSLVMRYGLELAMKHGVGTAAAGFRAEGIDITGEAAA